MEWGADPSQAESSWPAALQTCFGDYRLQLSVICISEF